jgi:pantetheine-phosphate adenylyltransferase
MKPTPNGALVYPHALTPAKVNPAIDTFFMMPSLEFQFLSSRLVRELASYKEDVHAYVSPHVAKALEAIT